MGFLPVLITSCHMPAGTKMHQPSETSSVKVMSSAFGPIRTCPSPASNRRNWSVSGCTSRPIDCPGSMDISVICRYLPVHATRR